MCPAEIVPRKVNRRGCFEPYPTIFVVRKTREAGRESALGFAGNGAPGVWHTKQRTQCYLMEVILLKV